MSSVRRVGEWKEETKERDLDCLLGDPKEIDPRDRGEGVKKEEEQRGKERREKRGVRN